MAIKFSYKKEFLFVPACIALIMCALSFSATAQRVKLRGQINTPCAIISGGDANAKFSDIYADGNIAVQGSYHCRGGFIYDISNPAAPVLLSRYNPGDSQQFLEAIVIGNRGYFGSGNSGGVHIVDLTNPANPVQLGVVNSTTGGGLNSIHEMMVFDQNGQRFLLENFNSTGNKTIKIINITNPAAPVYVRDLTVTEPLWVHAFHIRGNRLFTSGWGSGSSNPGRTEIYDISNIATQVPTLLGFISDTGSAGNSMHSSWSSEDGNYLYSCRELSNGDLRVYDIHNPAAPMLIKKITMASLGITAISPHNPVVMGNKLYVSWYQAGLVVFDISDPASPAMIGQYDTWPAAYAPTPEEQRALDNADPWDMMCGSDARQSRALSGYDGDWAVFPFLGEKKVLVGDLATGLYIVDVSLKNKVSDFDGDGKTDFSSFSPANGNWQIEKSSNGTSSNTAFGLSGDKITTGDYDGDGKSDIALFRPSTGVWYSLDSSNGAFRAQQFGVGTDKPVQGDYDGDGKTDIAVFRGSNGAWYINKSSGGVRIDVWGQDGDKPLVGDYDGDGKDDLTVFRGGLWYVLKSSNGQWIGASFGVSDDKPVEGDFDGDSKADIAIYRPSNGVWYVLNSSNGGYNGISFGVATDAPIPADYDGDGKTDYAIYRASEGNWYILKSTSGVTIRNFGAAGDVPSPSSVVPQ
jgi:hypothetical protein